MKLSATVTVASSVVAALTLARIFSCAVTVGTKSAAQRKSSATLQDAQPIQLTITKLNNDKHTACQYNSDQECWQSEAASLHP